MSDEVELCDCTNVARAEYYRDKWNGCRDMYAEAAARADRAEAEAANWHEIARDEGKRVESLRAELAAVRTQLQAARDAVSGVDPYLSDLRALHEAVRSVRRALGTPDKATEPKPKCIGCDGSGRQWDSRGRWTRCPNGCGTPDKGSNEK